MRGMFGRKDGKAKLLFGGLIKPNNCIKHIQKIELMNDKKKIKYILRVFASCRTMEQRKTCKKWGKDLIDRMVLSSIERQDAIFKLNCYFPPIGLKK